MIGYGLDSAERYRNLPDVGVLDELWCRTARSRGCGRPLQGQAAVTSTWGPVNRFFRSALFPLRIIAALAGWRCRRSRESQQTPRTETTSGTIQDVKTGQIDTTKSPVTIDPNKQSITATKSDWTTVTVQYVMDQSEASTERRREPSR